MPSTDDLKSKLRGFADKAFGFLPEEFRVPALIGVPVVIILSIVWIPSILKFTGSEPQPGAIDPAVLQAALEKEDLDRLQAMPPEYLKNEKLTRQTVIDMAKYEKNDKALADAEAAMARLQEVMKAKGVK